jgi:predicted aspartyl protease
MLALADAGAALTVMLGALRDRLGVHRLRRVSLVLADGRRAQRDVGEAMVAVNGDSVPCRVVFADSENAVLLGLAAREQLDLAADPVQRRLVPTDFLLC